MPMSRAARWFCATARIARPSRVQRKSAPSASMSPSEPPMMPSDTGATRTGPSTSGRLSKNDGNGNWSCVHARPAAARSTSERPSVMMSTSKWVAEIARRMTAHSMTQARSAAAATATSRTTTSGRASASQAAQPTNVEIISISPWAKLSVRVAL
ncbi:MAG: hypothetical protein A2W08_11710 [Candidatus Rokubacteria bacterium RBG_16_73_20]|nr:MAG: hypothetical protein A2W08_11710 [Candidatus Rokubacteria bacterium RBG_16_73_20]